MLVLTDHTVDATRGMPKKKNSFGCTLSGGNKKQILDLEDSRANRELDTAGSEQTTQHMKPKYNTDGKTALQLKCKIRDNYQVKLHSRKRILELELQLKQMEEHNNQFILKASRKKQVAYAKMQNDKTAFDKVSHSVLCILCSITSNIVQPSLSLLYSTCQNRWKTRSNHELMPIQK